MTHKQIEQKAYDYLDNLNRSGIILTGNEVYNAYIAGAHSRDEEIRELNDMVDTYREEISQLYKRCNNLFFENNQLRNPWISVEDRLPERYGKYYVIAGGEFDMAFYMKSGKWTTAYKEKIYIGSHTIVAIDEENGNEKEFEIPDFSYVHTNLTDIVTHWMPIPELSTTK